MTPIHALFNNGTADLKVRVLALFRGPNAVPEDVRAVCVPEEGGQFFSCQMWQLSWHPEDLSNVVKKMAEPQPPW